MAAVVVQHRVPGVQVLVVLDALDPDVVSEVLDDPPHVRVALRVAGSTPGQRVAAVVVQHRVPGVQVLTVQGALEGDKTGHASVREPRPVVWQQRIETR